MYVLFCSTNLPAIYKLNVNPVNLPCKMVSKFFSFYWHCTVEKKEYFAQLSAVVKIDFGLEIQSLPKCPFLNVFIRIYRPTKVDVLGNWEVCILFRNLWRFFVCFYRGTLYWLLMSLKWHQSWHNYINKAVFMNWPALLWQLLKLYPVVS